jgi:hypothetical protein
MNLRFWEREPIDMSIEGNFPDLELKQHGLRNRLHNFRIFRTQPVGRPKEIISSILVAIGIISAETAGTVVGIAIGGTVYGLTLGGLLTVVAVIGLTVWSMVGGASGGGKIAGGVESALEQNGQLVNTRQASKPLFVVYGIARVGGNWGFSR